MKKLTAAQVIAMHTEIIQQTGGNGDNKTLLQWIKEHKQ